MMMKKNDKIAIYYFSATGNSLKLSLDIASHYEHSEILKIDREKKKICTNVGNVGFIFPVYMGGVPKIVYNFLQNYPFENDVYYFSVGTYYMYKGCAMSIVDKILKDKGIELKYGNYLPSVGNCLMEYNVSEKKRIGILKHSEEITTVIINDILRKREKHPPMYYQLSENLHNKLFDIIFKNAHKKFSIESSCIGCGVCVKICPVNNIKIIDNIPQWGSSCEVCHSCVNWCPQNAINLGKSKGRLQYHNPHIKRKMLY